MADLMNFDATNIDPNDFQPIPAGLYEAVITNSEWRETRNKDGRYLKMEFEIITGEHKGRKLWENFNLQNKNQDAVRIARQGLAGVCHALNILTPKDSCELHNLPLVIKVGCRKAAEGQIVNVIKGYAAKNAATPAASAPVDNTKPWLRK